MSKIVVAMNAMIEHVDQITNVIEASSKEYYFLYKKKYKWSIKDHEENANVSLYFYPDEEPLEKLSLIGDNDWDEYSVVNYHSSDHRQMESTQTFRTLFSIVSEKAHGMDEILDDIISDM